MNRDHIIATLKARQTDLRRMGVVSLSLFGSVAREEAGAESDIDLLALYDHDAHLSLIDVVHIENFLQNLFGKSVQLVSEPIKRAAVRERVEAERVNVF